MLIMIGSTYLLCQNEVALGVLKALLTTTRKMYVTY